MAKLLATASILAILYFIVVVNATSNCHITTTTTTINEETCEDQMNGKDLDDCKQIIAGTPTDVHPLSCCRQLGAIEDIRCQCEALNKLLEEQEENGQDIEDKRRRASFIVTYCRMGTPAGCLRNAALSSILKNHI